MVPLFFTWFVWIIYQTHSQKIINSTTSNTTGDYFIFSSHNTFQQGIINCTSNRLCHIQCINETSCNDIKIYCNHVESCIIECPGDSSCKKLDLFISSKNTSISCRGYSACNPLNVITDFRNYPSSHSTLKCQNWAACNTLSILDPFGNNGYTSPNFEIYIIGGSWAFYILQTHPYPSAVATINNSTGEYYQHLHSYTNITCTHDKLCFIQCTQSGACRNSYIDCGHADECIILCDGYGSDDCSKMKIMARNNQQFKFECPNDGGWACGQSQLHIDNVVSVDIACTGSSFPCHATTFSVNLASDFELECKNGCMYSTIDINNVSNISIGCHGDSWTCQHSKFSINNTEQLNIDCWAYWGDSSCTDMQIDIASTKETNLDCTHNKACQRMDICATQQYDYGQLNIDCCGDYTDTSCNEIRFCSRMKITQLNMDCDCSGNDTNVCQNISVPYATTISPTEHIYTAVPSSSPMQRPTTSIVTNQPSITHQTTSLPTTTYPSLAPASQSTTTVMETNLRSTLFSTARPSTVHSTNDRNTILMTTMNIARSEAHNVNPSIRAALIIGAVITIVAVVIAIMVFIYLRKKKVEKALNYLNIEDNEEKQIQYIGVGTHNTNKSDIDMGEN